MRIHRPHLESFRDLSGFVFRGADGQVYRQVNRCFEEEYRFLIESGLYSDLIQSDLMIEHSEVSLAYKMTAEAGTVIRPRPIPMVSYPYEWCFGQLREAALLTLAVQRRALKFGGTLRDGSAFNIQFEGARPIFVDTLAFQRVRDGAQWPGYAQFCRHFVAPLGIMSQLDTRLGCLMRTHIDGIPLDLAASLLPWSTRISGGLRRHIHQQIRSPQDVDKSAKKDKPARSAESTDFGTQLALLDDLEETIRGLELPKSPVPTNGNNESTAVSVERQECVSAYLHVIRPKTVWDLCAHCGCTVATATQLGAHTVVFDSDLPVVEAYFQQQAATKSTAVLPLVVDWANPSPGAGWANTERASVMERGPADCVVAIDLFAQLTIVNDVAMIQVAEFLNQICRYLIIEFPTASEPCTAALLAAKGCHYEEYSRQRFEESFARNFLLLESRPIANGTRYLYFMEATG